jgi:hypothetical protein
VYKRGPFWEGATPSPNGLPSRVRLRYTRRLCENRLRVLPTMEINPILNSIKDLSERSETIRGYL